jgi:DNA polymerase-3 subunit epsilon
MILFFDTETTGLPKNWKAPVTDLDNWPRLVQLAYLVYDFDGNLIHSSNEIVKPNGFTIPVDASNVHGITTDIANQRGSKIEEVFELFSIHLKRAKVLVAHNMAYDEKIIGSEMIRLGMENTVDSKEKICTMESTVDLCKIDGPYGYKWPKLEELHRFLFNHDFDGAHDALADIQATAKCFWELKKQKSLKMPELAESKKVSKSKILLKFEDTLDQFGNQMKVGVFEAVLESLESEIYSNKPEVFNGEAYQLAQISFLDLNGEKFNFQNVFVPKNQITFELTIGNTYPFKITRFFNSQGIPTRVFTELTMTNYVILSFAIQNNRRIEIEYFNSKNEISNRKLLNVGLATSNNSFDEIRTYKMGTSYFTGFCVLRNETRTFRIDRVLKITILNEVDILKFKNDIIVPVKVLIGDSSWKLFSITKFEDIEIFPSFSDLAEFIDSNNICEWANYFPFDYSRGARIKDWGDWELKYTMNKTSINRYSLHFQGEEIKSFISLIKPIHEEEDGDEYFASYEFIELNRSFAVIVRLDSFPPDDWDDAGNTYLSTICFIDSFGNLYWENGERQYKRIENNKFVDINFDKLFTKFDFVVIGIQMWMSENLNVEYFKNGDKIYEARTNEDWIRANEAGQPAWCYYDNDPLNGEIYGKLYNWYAVNDPRGLAPEGWFIPSDKEWNELTEFLDEYLAFDKLRAENVWEYHYNSTNESGFSALPGGGRDANGGFYFFDYGYNKEIEEEYFESRNELGKDAYWWSTSIDENNNVRCFELSDNYEGMHSIYTDKGKGFSVRCLNNNFNKIEFVKIGNQKWMTENLNVDRFRNGDKIREARTNEEWELAGIRKLPVWCYANNDSKCDKLYNWYAVKDQRGLAPLGVKIPHNSDYLILIDFLGGEEIAGGKLQLVGYNPTIDEYEWNENGFQAISGHARFEFGHFVSSDIFFWSRTEKSIDQAGYFKIEKDGSKAQIGNTKKSTGYFVRCLKE